MTNEERLMLAISSLRSARASKKEFPKGSEGYAWWNTQAQNRKGYVQELERMYKIKYHQL